MSKHFIYKAFFIFFTIQNPTFGQNLQVLDSLQTIYKQAKHDTSSVLGLLSMAKQYKEQKKDTCLQICQNALFISKHIGFLKGICKSHIIMGEYYVKKNDYIKALSKFHLVLSLVEHTQEKHLTAELYHHIGITHFYQANHSLALEYQIKSLKLNQELNQKELEADNYNVIAGVYYQQKNFDSALEYQQKALEIVTKLGNKNRIALSLNNISGVYYAKNDYQTVLKYLQKALQIREEIGDKIGIGYSLNSIGFTHTKLNNHALALDYQLRSLKLREELDNKYDLIYSLQGVAKAYQKIPDYEKSIMYAEKGLELAKAMKTANQISSLLVMLYEVHKEKGDFPKALAYYEMYKQNTDSLFNVEKSEKIANLESTLKVEKKQKEIEILQKKQTLKNLEIEQQKTAALALEKQHEANSILAQAKQEKDSYKQDSLTTLAQMKQLEANKFKLQSQVQLTEIQKQKEAQKFQQIILYISLFSLCIVSVLAYLMYQSKQKIAMQNEEIAHQNEEILVQSENLYQSNATKDKLFAIIGHDLRNPVATLKGVMGLAASKELSVEEFNELSGKLLENVDYMHFTLNNLLLWANTQMKGMDTNPQNMNLNMLVKENFNFLKSMAKNKNIALQNNLPEETSAWADTNQISLVFRNLISNAIKFTPQNGKIDVSAMLKGQYWEISIKDTGVGMKPEILENAFKKNIYISTSGTNSEKGTGLGLILCQEMVEKNGGKIQIETVVGRGTTFKFTLPTKA